MIESKLILYTKKKPIYIFIHKKLKCNKQTNLLESNYVGMAKGSVVYDFSSHILINLQPNKQIKQPIRSYTNTYTYSEIIQQQPSISPKTFWDRL